MRQSVGMTITRVPDAPPEGAVRLRRMLTLPWPMFFGVKSILTFACEVFRETRRVAFCAIVARIRPWEPSKAT